ncbi:type I polyketide synthase [Geomonas sp. Red32]|uniref:beta-ketoacyl synthase N-terminal-like domain-containing protein n=1 Tax=Geomonas sp. Red32 TaxID=2912856 RepID=UPI00202CED96|nr:beta-ketoacyl synthase N-terminal-like domain-containing protein [Geomonas sp. Red32]MCM0081525.1 type I polyketide synthase [Geomonas sp. Red32]
MKEQSPSVAIVGIGGIFPGAPDLTTFWENIRSAKSAAREVPEGRWQISADTAFDPEPGKPDHVYSRRGCFVEELPPLSELDGLFIDQPQISRLDPAFRLLLHAGKRAFGSAVTKPVDLSRVGVIIGNLALPSEKSAEITRALLGRTFEEKLIGKAIETAATEPLNRYVAGLPAGLLAAALGLGGGAFTLDAACASSLYAIKLAVDELTSGRADAMLTGGLSRPDPLFTQMGFSQLRALSKRGICAPFDATGDGLVVGEGAGIFVLKRTQDALKHGDKIYGIIRGVGVSNDVGGSLLAPLSDGQLRAMRGAYAKAGWAPQDVDLIECHATGTPVGDATEVASLKELWGAAPGSEKCCVIGSVKSNIGHLLTAAGSAALTKVLLAMAEETLPPTANFAQAPANFGLEQSPFGVLKSPAPWIRRGDGIPRRAGVSAFGFGGINAHLLVEEWVGQEELEEVDAAVGAHVDSKANPPCPPFAKGGTSGQTGGDDIAIVGLDARFGKWQSLASFQAHVLGGDQESKPGRPTDWWGAEKSEWFAQDGLSSTPFAGYFVDGFSVPLNQFRIPPREMEEMLPQQLLMLQSAAAAIGDAKLDRSENLRAGVFVGIALDLNSTNFSFRWSIAEKARIWAKELGLDLNDEQLAAWIQELREKSGPALTANRTMGALGSVVASRVAREFRCGGPSFTISSEESSGIHALQTAVRQLQLNEIDRAIVGAVDLAGDLRAAWGHHMARPFSKSGRATPFDQSADGTVIGEGAAALVLKRLEDAQAAGDRIYAVIKGVGDANGELKLPGAAAYRRALERAYREAGIDPVRVGLVEAHGSGDPAEDRMECAALSDFFQPAGSTSKFAPRRLPVTAVKGTIGHCGAASGIASLARAALALYQEIIPPAPAGKAPLSKFSGNDAFFLPSGPRFWLRNRAEGPRHAGVSAFGVDGGCCHVVLEGYDSVPAEAKAARIAPLGSGTDFLFPIAGSGQGEIAEALLQLRDKATLPSPPDIATLSRDLIKRQQAMANQPLAMSLVARSPDELIGLIDQAERLLSADSVQSEAILHPSLRDRLFFSRNPLGATGKIGFVFPGSGNHFADMGKDLSARWPEIFRRQDAENQYLREQFQPEAFWNGAPIEEVNEDHLAVIFGQVATGCAVSDIVQGFGIKPNAVITYSLGESAGLIATRTWQERDLMLSRMKNSTLFTHDLAGECRAVRKAWGEMEGKEINWCIGVVDAPAREVRRALKKSSHVYLLIVNTPDECVIGGDVKWVKHVVAMLDCRFFPLQGVTTVHCEVARPVAEAYRDLHLFNTYPPSNVTFYSGAYGASYQVNRRSAAESILAQALEGIDFPKVIDAAYEDGVRIFIEMGPGASCTRMIGRILNKRPHAARAVCFPGGDENSAVVKLLAHLFAERVPMDLEPLMAGYAKDVPIAGAKSLKCVTGCGGFDVAAAPHPHPNPPLEGEGVIASDLARSGEGVIRTDVAGTGESVVGADLAGTGAGVVGPDLSRTGQGVIGSVLPGTGERVAGADLAGAEQGVIGNGAAHLEQTQTVGFAVQEGFDFNTGGASVIESAVSPAPEVEFVPAAFEGAGTHSETATGMNQNIHFERQPAISAADSFTAPQQTFEHPAPVNAPATPVPGAEQDGVDSLLQNFAAAQQATLQAHDAYLRVAGELTRSMTEALALQLALQEKMLAGGVPAEPYAVDTLGDTLGAAGAVDADCMHAAVNAGSAAGAAVYLAPAVQPVRPVKPAVFDRDMCMEFAIGSVGRMLGPAFAEADSFPTRVRLPDEPMMLVDRMVTLEGEPKSMTSGRVVTEHDVLPGAWYLDGGRIPTCIAVEAGQADLFLSGYLGIDFITRGLAVYRLLDAVVTFHRELPRPGETISYDIRIERFFRQNDTYLFRFHFESTVNGEPLLSMRNGCAGFFSQAELDAGKGIVRGALDLRPTTGKLPADWQDLVPMEKASYTGEQLDCLRQGDLAGCFGQLFQGLSLTRPLTIPGGRMRLVHRVIELVPKGGHYQLGFIRAEADIRPDDWFITCHFVDDKVMPGTLMYECCMHTLRIFLLRMGWITEGDEAAWQPVPGVASQLCCRGQVLENTKVVTYEVTVRELGYRPEPYAIVDALMYADGKPIVEITNMSARLTGTDRDKLTRLWAEKQGTAAGSVPQAGFPHPLAPSLQGRGDVTRKPAVYTKEQILAYSNGNPSEGFGDKYKVFDRERKIARLPGPPFQFMDRVTAVGGEPWKMVPGAMAEAQYDIPVNEWYFGVERQGRMPFSVILEAALQPCGWLAAYVGSALSSPTDISFRNLGGTAVQYRPITPESGTLTATANLTKVANSGGMIIQEFTFSVADRDGVVYDGDTMFGFFGKEALANQVGIRDAAIYQPNEAEAAAAECLPYPAAPPFPDTMLRMIDTIEMYLPNGGPAGLGYVKGTKQVQPEEWFFKAHFYEDPVTPGSLGLESFLQLVKFAAVRRWGWSEGDVLAAVALDHRHRWLYRGQVVPTNKEVTVTAWITKIDDQAKVMTADGFLSVDGRVIYQMNDFTVRIEKK